MLTTLGQPGLLARMQAHMRAHGSTHACSHAYAHARAGVRPTCIEYPEYAQPALSTQSNPSAVSTRRSATERNVALGDRRVGAEPLELIVAGSPNRGLAGFGPACHVGAACQVPAKLVRTVLPAALQILPPDLVPQVVTAVLKSLPADSLAEAAPTILRAVPTRLIPSVLPAALEALSEDLAPLVVTAVLTALPAESLPDIAPSVLRAVSRPWLAHLQLLRLWP